VRYPSRVFGFFMRSKFDAPLAAALK